MKTTIEEAVGMGAVKTAKFERVIVDTTVQEKPVAHPSDSRLLEVKSRVPGWGQLATRAGVSLKQTYAAEGQQLRRRAGGYAPAKSYKTLRPRAATATRHSGQTAARHRGKIADSTQPALKNLMERALRILRRRPHDSNKLYALHAPKVKCNGKGEAHQSYEFGVKVSMAVTHKSGVIFGARSFPGNPYDGHTLAGQIEQSEPAASRWLSPRRLWSTCATAASTTWCRSTSFITVDTGP